MRGDLHDPVLLRDPRRELLAVDAAGVQRDGSRTDAEAAACPVTEDRAAECFVQMCHALSNKINAKISRQRLDAKLSQIADRLESRDSEGD